MSVLLDLLQDLSGARVHDLHVPGWLEHDRGVSVLRSLPTVIYIELEDKFLRLAAVGNRGGLELAMVPEMAPPAGMDEDDEFATAQIGDLFFDTGSPSSIARVRYVMNGESDAERAIVRCAEFQVGPFVRIFADPGWLGGVRLSVNGGYDDWMDSESDREREIFGSVAEFVWEPPSPGERP